MPDTNKIKSNDQPILILRLFQLLGALGALPFLFNTVDVILHPSAAPLDAAMGNRVFTGLLISPLTVLIAVLCIRRAPRNLIGWMLLNMGYGSSSLVMRLDVLPLQQSVLIGNWFIGGFWIAFLLIPLYFPDGMLYPRWINRLGNAFISLLLFFLLIISDLFNPEITFRSASGIQSVPNPFFWYEWDYTVVTIPAMVMLLVAGIVTVFLRYRDGTELARLQLRWLFFGLLIQAVATLLIALLPDSQEGELAWISGGYTIIIPAAVGVAVLRYRLYDIDLIIRRTLVYSVLSGALGLLYLGSVVIFQSIFRTISGQAEQPALAVVLSTLIIAALFSPLRRRIQTLIDRSFFRQRYNMDQTLQRFAGSLRNETNPDQINRLLVAIIQQTVQPAQVSLWLKRSTPPAADSHEPEPTAASLDSRSPV